MRDDLSKLVGASYRRVGVVTPTARQPVEAARSAVTHGGAGGIKGPLVEVSEPGVTERSWYAPHTVVSSDGLITFELQSLATLPMRDGAGTLFEMRFIDPL